MLDCIANYLWVFFAVSPSSMFLAREEKWDGKPLAEKPLFYQGVDDFTEKVLLGLSDEVQDVCRKVARTCWTMRF